MEGSWRKVYLGYLIVVEMIGVWKRFDSRLPAKGVLVMMATAFAAVTMAVAFTVVMALTACVGVGNQRTGEEFLYSLVYIALNAIKETDACRHQGLTGTRPDVATNDRVDIAVFEPLGQRFVAYTIGVDDFACRDGAISNGIELEVFRTAKVLENLFLIYVFYCDFMIAAFLYLMA